MRRSVRNSRDVEHGYRCRNSSNQFTTTFNLPGEAESGDSAMRIRPSRATSNSDELRADVRMIQLRDGLRLALEARLQLRVLHEFAGRT